MISRKAISDSPAYAAASGVDFAFSPDSNELALRANPDKVKLP